MAIDTRAALMGVAVSSGPMRDASPDITAFATAIEGIKGETARRAFQADLENLSMYGITRFHYSDAEITGAVAKLVKSGTIREVIGKASHYERVSK